MHEAPNLKSASKSLQRKLQDYRKYMHTPPGPLKARIWLAPNDGLYGRVWVWHVKGGRATLAGSGFKNFGHHTTWEGALDACLAHMRKVVERAERG